MGTPSVVFLLLGAPSAAAQPLEPWSDEPSAPETRHAFGSYGVSASAEYRSIAVGGLPLDFQRGTDLVLVEQRLRLGASVDYDEWVALTLSIDGLDGAVWGRHPSAAAVTAGPTAPAFGAAGARVGYRGVGEPTLPESYGLVLDRIESIELRLAYGELWTDIGLFRIGRQTAFPGSSILASDAAARTNRFGYAGDGDLVDRVLYVTKPFEAGKEPKQRDRSEDRGLFTFLHYDRLADARPTTGSDDVQSGGVGVRWLEPRPDLRQSFDLWALVSHRWQTSTDTHLTTFGLRALATGHRLSAGVELLATTGDSAAAARVLALDEAAGAEAVRQFGARGVLRWDEPSFTLYLEIDHASGDGAPGAGTPYTRFAFSPDANVGLLLFERVLAYESARSAAAAGALLEGAGMDPAGAEILATRGAFTSATAIFPQLDLRPTDDLLLRYGVLVAWSPVRLSDPVRSGLTSGPAAVNYHGGAPGQFYGVELDARVSWSYVEHFFLDLEGALLLPGDALEDENGEAPNSGLAQLRATFLF